MTSTKCVNCDTEQLEATQRHASRSLL